jgi:hypothetical protein
MWCGGGGDDYDEEGEGGASEEEDLLDELFVGMGHLGVQIRWDGEPELP